VDTALKYWFTVYRGGCGLGQASGGWDEPLMLLGIAFAALAGYAWFDPARGISSVGTKETPGGRGWFG
jgi:hypothetical protein